MKRFKYFIFALLLLGLLLSIPELIYKNKGESISLGKSSSGKLENAYLMPYRGKNFKYFSPFSYFIMNNGYTNSRVYRTLLESYETMSKIYPKQRFYIMECSDKSGGKLSLHKTHQNGMSIDFMVPKKRKKWRLEYNEIGLLHYLLEFDPKGFLNFDSNVEIDFEMMGKHILSLDDSARKNGLKIRIVILKLNLKDDLYNTEAGKEIKRRNIYFAQSLPKWTNKMHDDHYHIDFIMK